MTSCYNGDIDNALRTLLQMKVSLSDEAATIRL